VFVFVFVEGDGLPPECQAPALCAMSGGVLNFEMLVLRDLVATWGKVMNLDRFDLA
jgi:hypothetical protein